MFIISQSKNVKKEKKAFYKKFFEIPNNSIDKVPCKA